MLGEHLESKEEVPVPQFSTFTCALDYVPRKLTFYLNFDCFEAGLRWSSCLSSVLACGSDQAVRLLNSLRSLRVWAAGLVGFG